VRQNFINQQQQSHTGVMTSPVGYNSDLPSNTNCQKTQQQQQQFRLPRNMNIATANSQIQG